MPNRFLPLNSDSSLKSVITQINTNFRQLDAETYSKTIQSNGNSQMVSGKLSTGRYGEVFYDASGMPRILIGQASGDARPGIWITKRGYNVLDEVK